MNTIPEPDPDFRGQLESLRPATNPVTGAEVLYRCGYEAGFRQGRQAIAGSRLPQPLPQRLAVAAAMLLAVGAGSSGFMLGRGFDDRSAMIADAKVEMPVVGPVLPPTEDTSESADTKPVIEKQPVFTHPVFTNMTDNGWWPAWVGLQRLPANLDSGSQMMLGSSMRLRQLPEGDAANMLLAGTFLRQPPELADARRETSRGKPTSPYSIRMPEDAWEELLQ